MKPSKSVVFCRDAGRKKTIFETEKKAMNFISFNAAEIRRSGGFAPVRAYACISCGGWHVTSRRVLLDEPEKSDVIREAYAKDVEATQPMMDEVWVKLRKEQRSKEREQAKLQREAEAQRIIEEHKRLTLERKRNIQLAHERLNAEKSEAQRQREAKQRAQEEDRKRKERAQKRRELEDPLGAMIDKLTGVNKHFNGLKDKVYEVETNIKKNESKILIYKSFTVAYTMLKAEKEGPPRSTELAKLLIQKLDALYDGYKASQQ